MDPISVAASARKIVVVGGGWAGLAAAVEAVQRGYQVSLMEMAGHLGGRARSLEAGAQALDNGQHILIGAYTETLRLMAQVGVDLNSVLARQKLVLEYGDGRRFALPRGPRALAFARAAVSCNAWTLGEGLNLLRWSAGQALRGFQCDPQWSAARLTESLPPSVRRMLIDPLCVAALNTPAEQASARVLLRVLKDALFGGPDSADLLLPKCGLSALLPEPAHRWLTAKGAELRLGERARNLEVNANSCSVNGQACDAVVLACTASEAARLVRPLNADWAGLADAIRYEPIVTVVLRNPGARLPQAMTALLDGPQAPAQFAFDHGALGAQPGQFSFVVSGARQWVERGLAFTADAVMAQAAKALPAASWPASPDLVRVLAEKRATFRCSPNLHRPGARPHPRVMVAGDYVEGPYPATLEGAVRSGVGAIRDFH